ncbi:acetyl esterase/lipase [Humibacillus xanthopallidus]|uniref:Acetyl esterase/lipase n=2 Tax=Humibacillus xanthopallidus TaxID=412689 RepID=A0A543I206_9MICO|nr:acetyl esterase/lipase [Humibacillus xanthopallidus]
MAAMSTAPRSEPAPLPPSSPPAATRAYGADPAQVYDVRLPPPGVIPLHATVLVVHGGFWRAAYDRAHAEPEARAFAEAGYTVAVAEYRRVGMPGGGVPGTLDDVRGVITAVLADPELPQPVVLVGHSAGGHLVTWAAAQPWIAEGHPGGVAGAVALAGVVDLGAADRMQLGDGAARAFVGSDAGSAAWAAADPMSSHPRVPVRLIWGDEDDVVPAAVGDAYLAQARAAGADVRSEVIRGADHFALIDPTAPAFRSVLATVHALLP